MKVSIALFVKEKRSVVCFRLFPGQAGSPVRFPSLPTAVRLLPDFPEHRN